MESIYYVMAWACQRRCKHCYEERFRPYIRRALTDVGNEAMRNFPRIIDNFPEHMRLYGQAIRTVPAPRHAPVRPVGNHPQLA
jgi:hypothetical protein